jgi:hypothetical protein
MTDTTDYMPRKDLELPPPLGFVTRKDYDDTLAAKDAEIERLQSALERARPVVKPLKWDKGVVDWARPLPGMKYVACSTTPAGSWAWWLEGADDRGVEVSEDAAKAAAQADYERRILSVFVQPSPDMGVDEVRGTVGETWRAGRCMDCERETTLIRDLRCTACGGGHIVVATESIPAEVLQQVALALLHHDAATAFILNHTDAGGFHEKFTADLSECRAALCALQPYLRAE